LHDLKLNEFTIKKINEDQLMIVLMGKNKYK